LKVLLVQPVFPHYRESLFSNLLTSPKVSVHILCGSGSGELSESTFRSAKLKKTLKNFKFTIFGFSFIYQIGLLKEFRNIAPSHVIIGGPDFHFVSSFVLILYCSLFFRKVKLSYWTHGIPAKKSSITKRIIKQIYIRAFRIFSYGSEGKIEIEKFLGNNNNEKIVPIGNCLNDMDYPDASFKKNNHSKGQLNILFVGRLNVNKRCDLLVEAISLLRSSRINFQCSIVGNGEQYKTINAKVEHLGLSNNVKLFGEIKGEELKLHLLNADILVLPGKVGLSVVQGLAYGLPLISTSKKIHSPEFELVEDKINGFLFDEMNANSLFETLLYYNNLSVNQKAMVSSNCIEKVKNAGYLPKIVSHKMVSAFEVG
jgi:glycosyltransferase involved in cell wall biosynthesis